MPVVGVALPVFFGLGVLSGVLNISALSTVLAIVPERIQGRYFAIETMVSYAAIPAAQVLGGVRIVLRGLPFTFGITAVGSVATGGAPVFLKELRALGYDPRAPPPLTPG
ncbi:MAG: hypothetical protein ACRECT_07540 [Thermoplasmata archaeon]